MLLAAEAHCVVLPCGARKSGKKNEIRLDRTRDLGIRKYRRSILTERVQDTIQEVGSLIRSSSEEGVCMAQPPSSRREFEFRAVGASVNIDLILDNHGP